MNMWCPHAHNRLGGPLEMTCFCPGKHAVVPLSLAEPRQTSVIILALQAQDCLGGHLCRKLHPVPTINEVD